MAQIDILLSHNDVKREASFSYNCIIKQMQRNRRYLSWHIRSVTSASPAARALRNVPFPPSLRARASSISMRTPACPAALAPVCAPWARPPRPDGSILNPASAGFFIVQKPSPSGGSSARKTVRRTVFSENGLASPRQWRGEAVTEEVVSHKE